ncbi:MAG: CPBP family intramembrane metalloprotease [Limnochordales bacterium]
MIAVALGKLVMYLCLTLIMGYWVLHVCPRERHPEADVPRGVLVTAYLLFPVALLIPPLYVSYVITPQVEETFWQVLKSVLMTFEMGEALLAGVLLVGGLGLVLINVLGSRAAVAAFRVLLGEEGLARQLARERAAITDLFQLDLPLPVLLLLLLASVVMAPVSEEIFFRGYVHGVLRARLGAGAAYVSAAAFAAAHMYLVHFLPLFLMGILLARLYERGGTLVAPVLAHAVVNLVVALSLRL